MIQSPMKRAKKILIVDDDSFIRNFLQIILTKTGYEVIMAGQGEEGLLQAKEERPDIIISDIMMPVTDGIEFCQKLKSDPQLKETLFLILTAKNSTQDRVELLNLGADDFISKPIDKNELLAKINAFSRILDLQLELKQKNQDLQQVNQELTQTTEMLRQVNRKLVTTQNTLIKQEKMASFGQLSAGMAEKMEGPIQILCNNLNILNNYMLDTKALIHRQELAIEKIAKNANYEAKAVSKDLQEFKDQIDTEFILHDSNKVMTELISESEKLKRIIEQLKDYLSADLHSPRNASINDCLDDSLDLVMIEIRGKATINKEYTQLPEIKCHPQQLIRVFINVLLNAIQAIEENGIIEIVTERNENDILVRISDNGIGIPKDILPKIFEPFFTTKEVGSITGLGLSIAQSILKKYDGKIEVKSEIGRGTQVEIYLPITGLSEEKATQKADEMVTCIELN